MAYDIKVINIADARPPGYYCVDIMRPNVLGNPFFLKDENQRENCNKKFKNYLWNEMQNPNSRVYKTLKRCAQTANDIALVCCCKPKACHGDVARDAILWLRRHPEHLFRKK